MLSAEIIAFSDLFDATYTSATYFENVYRKPNDTVKLEINWKSLFEIIRKGNRTYEKGFMLDILCARKRYRMLEINGIGSVHSRYNFADGVTNKMMKKMFIVSAKYF